MNNEETINRMLSQCLKLQGNAVGTDGKQVSLHSAVENYIGEVAKTQPDPEAAIKQLEDAWADPAKMRALNALRTEQVNNFVHALSNWSSAFFEVITLGKGDQPVIENTTRQEIKVTAMGEDGHPERTRIVRPYSNEKPALRFISTPRVHYKTEDVYKGDIADISRAQFDLARDMADQLDEEHRTLLTLAASAGGAFGEFKYEQDKADDTRHIYVPHSRIDTTQLPLTNDYDMTLAPATVTPGSPMNPSANGNLTRFGLGVLQAIAEYATLWGRWLPDSNGTPLVPTGEIIMPSADIFAIAEDNLPLANNQESTIQESVNRNGWFGFNYLGVNWKFIPDITIPSGMCYPRFNLLPGKSFRKPAFDRQKVETNDDEGWEERWQRSVFGAVIVNQHRPRAMRIRYKA